MRTRRFVLFGLFLILTTAAAYAVTHRKSDPARTTEEPTHYRLEVGGVATGDVVRTFDEEFSAVTFDTTPDAKPAARAVDEQTSLTFITDRRADVAHVRGIAEDAGLTYTLTAVRVVNGRYHYVFDHHSGERHEQYAAVSDGTTNPRPAGLKVPPLSVRE